MLPLQESYAGAYIPTLMDQIHTRGGINLKGAAVGNGVSGGNGPGNGGDGGRIRAKFYLGKGMVSEELGQQIIAACGPLAYPSSSGWKNHTPACDQALGMISQQAGPHNLYNVEDFCPSTSPDSGGPTLDDWDRAMEPHADGTMPRMDALLHNSPTRGIRDSWVASGEPLPLPLPLPLGEEQRWCGVDNAMMTWLAVPSVMKALHIAHPKGTERNNLRYTAYS